MRKMKSLVLKAPNKLEFEERPVPTPCPLEALVRVSSSGICHTDIQTLIGERPEISFPAVLGHEFSGVVEECGPGVMNVKPGDRVCSMGWTYCGVCPNCRRGRHNGCPNIRAIPFHIEGANQEYLTIPALTLFPVADSMSMEYAAVAEPAANAFSVAERGEIFPGDNVVVMGAGPIGLLTLQFARLKQPKSLIALEMVPNRLKMAAKLGATHTVNIKETDPYEAVMDITGGSGADAVLICGGASDSWDLAGRVIAPYGRIALEAAPPTYDAKYSVWIMGLHSKHASYLGICGFTGAQFGAALEMIRSGKIDIDSVISHRFGLDDALEAFEIADKRKDESIKVLINM